MRSPHVVPRAGTWIETLSSFNLFCLFPVVPRAGTWIETKPAQLYKDRLTEVVPRAGTWIETISAQDAENALVSFPVRERGLKHKYDLSIVPILCRSPCGNVD